MKKRNNLKWWHHILIFCGAPIGVALFGALLIGLVKLIELTAGSHRDLVLGVTFFLLLGSMGYFSAIDELKK